MAKKLMIICFILLLIVLISLPGCNGSKTKYADIFAAINAEDHKAVKIFLKKDPSLVNIENENNYTPLHYACKSGQKEIAELLISKGADVNAVDNNNYTPLHWACFKGYKNLAELLISKNADINARTKLELTPLRLASEQGNKEIADFLILKGADLNATDIFGKTSQQASGGIGILAVTSIRKNIAKFIR